MIGALTICAFSQVKAADLDDLDSTLDEVNSKLDDINDKLDELNGNQQGNNNPTPNRPNGPYRNETNAS
jgi:hypothetical protein